MEAGAAKNFQGHTLGRDTTYVRSQSILVFRKSAANKRKWVFQRSYICALRLHYPRRKFYCAMQFSHHRWWLVIILRLVRYTLAASRAPCMWCKNIFLEVVSGWIIAVASSHTIYTACWDGVNYLASRSCWRDAGIQKEAKRFVWLLVCGNATCVAFYAFRVCLQIYKREVKPIKRGC